MIGGTKTAFLGESLIIRRYSTKEFDNEEPKIVSSPEMSRLPNSPTNSTYDIAAPLGSLLYAFIPRLSFRSERTTYSAIVCCDAKK